MARPARVTRAQVLEAARAACAERGFARVTLAEIGRRLGITAAAVLRHAPDKESLLREALLAPGGGREPLPFEFLRETSGDRDPREVLTRLAREYHRFAGKKIGEQMATWQALQGGGASLTLRLPFDPESPDSPPRRGFRLVADWFARAEKAGRLKTGDPRAAALGFMGALHGHVFFHQVLRNVHPAVPFDGYLETLLSLWLPRAAPRPSAARRSSR